MLNIEKALNTLPVEAQREVFDFIEFLLIKYGQQDRFDSTEERNNRLRLSEKALEKIWDNEKDDIYNELLKR